MTAGLVDRYLELGLRLGRHVDGFVDAYYGPAELAARVDAEAVRSARALVGDAARLLVDLDAGVDGDALDAARRC
jgi:L-alanine-DL-glutamate epimerase-like enolase superfamily enzyme